MPLDLQVAETEFDAKKVFEAYRAMHGEGGIPGAFHPLKTLTNVLRMMKGPGSVVLMAMDGETLAGVLALYEDSYWWSEDRHLGDKGLYVLPEYRNGEAFELLLQGAAQTADDLKLPVYITVFNAKRKRGGRSQWERAGLTLGYTNQGATLAHLPETSSDG